MFEKFGLRALIGDRDVHLGFVQTNEMTTCTDVSLASSSQVSYGFTILGFQLVGELRSSEF